MTRIGNLKHQWCNYESLLRAYREVRKSKSNYYTFIDFERKLAVNLERILTSLINGTYEVKPYRTFEIYDPKQRTIHAPHLEDRIAQHSLMNAIRQTIENRFISNTFACIKNRGTHQASNILLRYLKNFKGVGYFLKIDIKKFFYTIDHRILKAQVERIIKCKETTRLLFKFVNNVTGVGLPLGNVTSQLLANLALNPVDHFVKRVLRVKHYVRYMDDMVLLHSSKKFLKRCLENIEIVISGLKLQTNNKTKICRLTEGIDFVGFRTWYNCRLIRKRSLKKFLRKLKRYADVEVLQSYLAHAKHTNSYKHLILKLT